MSAGTRYMLTHMSVHMCIHIRMHMFIHRYDYGYKMKPLGDVAAFKVPDATHPDRCLCTCL